MKSYKDIDLGSSDARNYKKSSNKTMFREIFVKNDSLEKLFDKKTYYLIGDKGTGKTAYATFIKNSDNYKNTKGEIITVKETDYKMFYKMKRENNLNLSDYTRMWKVIIMLYISKCIKMDDPAFPRGKKFKDLRETIDNYYAGRFKPEVVTMHKYIEDKARQCQVSAGAGLKIVNTKSEISSEKKNSEEREGLCYQNSLLELEEQFIEGLSSLKLNSNIFVFFDEIDISSSDIPHKDYLEIIKGLAEAVYEINNSPVADLKKSKGFIKVILLIRPDIFSKLSLYNHGGLIRNNSILLDWRTNNKDYRTSALFEMCDKILAYNNGDKTRPIGHYWDLYFPWKRKKKNADDEEEDSFIEFLSKSLWKPRDLISFMEVLQNIERKSNFDTDHTKAENFYSAECSRMISEYFLTEMKDWALFRYSDKQYEEIIYFFDFLNGLSKFSYDEYLIFHRNYIDQVKQRFGKLSIEEAKEPEQFLQLLFDMNFIGYVEKDKVANLYYRHCYKERSYFKLNPNIMIGSRYSYRVHGALLKGLNLGREIMAKFKIS